VRIGEVDARVSRFIEVNQVHGLKSSPYSDGEDSK
jgi:hypothetical protein